MIWCLKWASLYNPWISHTGWASTSWEGESHFFAEHCFEDVSNDIGETSEKSATVSENRNILHLISNVIGDDTSNGHSITDSKFRDARHWLLHIAYKVSETSARFCNIWLTFLCFVDGNTRIRRALRLLKDRSKLSTKEVIKMTAVNSDVVDDQIFDNPTICQPSCACAKWRSLFWQIQFLERWCDQDLAYFGSRCVQWHDCWVPPQVLAKRSHSAASFVVSYQFTVLV